MTMVSSDYNQRIDQALRYIKLHLAEAISLEQAARAAFTPFPFLHIFLAAMDGTRSRA